jgi:cytochrome c553
VTHKVVSAVVGVIVLLFVAAAVAFAWSVAARAPEATAQAQAGPADVPHGIEAAAADCSRCHRVSEGSLPLTHREFPLGACANCHALRRPVAIPHTVSMGEDRCVLCHGEAGAPLGMPADHRSYEGVSCVFCHPQNERRASVQPPPAGESAKQAPPVRHAVTGIFKDCLTCHEVDGRPPMPASHLGFGGDTCRFVCHFRAGGR